MSKNPRLSKPFLPREGLTLEAMFYPVQSLFLQPLLTGPLAYLLLARPEFVQKAIPWGGRLESFISKKSTAVGFCILFGVGILSRLSSWLSRWSVNNFVRDKTWDWTKEIVIVTGGSSGIGLEMVNRFAQLRIKTIILDVVPPSAGVLETAGVFFYKVDLSSPSAIALAAAEVKLEHGHPSVLISNAGIGVAKNILDENETERRRLFDVNVLAHFTLAREFLPAMIENDHGHLVTVASMASFYTQAQNVSYACSKAAAMAFHEGIGQELRVRYNAPRVRTT
ncbi:Dehydrogenase RED2 [Lasiodiplodia theobromae]|uniref:Dehydrogenase RED2 n=1 Tax=Lasiodiplodia theobromae TaxID=45133 RepID=A0A5N5D7W4_9PEZI|nr:Dehydrogenase RED2 [Lasiodiplodia theobromae]